MIEASLSTQAAFLANQYIIDMYYTPVVDQKPNIPALANLLGKAQIIWIRNGVEAEYTFPQMIEKLMAGYYEGMSKIVVVATSVFSNELSPRAETQTIQYWKGSESGAPGPYFINSNINFTIEKDPITLELFISRVIHNYTSFPLIDSNPS